MSIKGFFGISKPHHRADAGNPNSEPAAHTGGSTRRATAGPLSGLMGLTSKRPTNPHANVGPGRDDTASRDIGSMLSHSLMSTVRVTEKGMKVAGKTAYKGTGTAGKAAFSGAKKAAKWLDKQFQGGPSRSHIAPELSDEERYYGHRSGESDADHHSVSSRNDYSELFRPRNEVYRKSTRLMTPEERKAADEAAAYHGHKVDSYTVDESRWVKTPHTSVQRQRTPQHVYKQHEDERSAHQEAIDNGYL